MPRRSAARAVLRSGSAWMSVRGRSSAREQLVRTPVTAASVGPAPRLHADQPAPLTTRSIARSMSETDRAALHARRARISALPRTIRQRPAAAHLGHVQKWLPQPATSAAARRSRPRDVQRSNRAWASCPRPPASTSSRLRRVCESSAHVRTVDHAVGVVS